MLNKPVQSSCGCVICTKCYRSSHGCVRHQVSSTRCHVNTTASFLANCSEFNSVCGDWNVKLKTDDHFMTAEAVNPHVQQMMRHVIDIPTLRVAFRHLLTADDSFSFCYWSHKHLPEEVAYRYVCIPHLPDFWDHVNVGCRPAPDTATMIGQDDNLPKLFGVQMGCYKYHWSCFVLDKEINLYMWCSSMSVESQVIFPLVDASLVDITSSIQFRQMVYYLAEWFTIQYVAAERRFNVVLDCCPDQGTLVDVIIFLAWKVGMPKFNPCLPFRRHRAEYSFNVGSAREMFTCPFDANEGVDCINIMEEYNCFHSKTAAFFSGLKLQRHCTSTEYYGSL
ncbi:uncharacterized protein LOC134007590 [Osmerus eperlanus]|uniref:uncharacterized protein LOC134007590 n=1 Tax=Osmerus eperlanus TaxID=29151 RepID=UPI002E10B539